MNRGGGKRRRKFIFAGTQLRKKVRKRKAFSVEISGGC